MDSFGDCEPINSHPQTLSDNFDDKQDGSKQLNVWWKQTKGGAIGNGCDIIDEEKSLYFGDVGTRQVQTTSIDTSNMRYN